MECTKVNCPMQARTPTDNCGENCPWRTTAKTSDLISRAAAIKEIEDLMKHYRQIGAECDRDGALFARERIKKLPAVDTVPVVHARWIETKIPANTTEHGGVGQDKKNGWLCSNCRCAFDAKLLWCKNYCPNCGAKMDGKNS